MRIAGGIVITTMAVAAVTAAWATEPKALRFLDSCGDRIACVDMVLSSAGAPGLGDGNVGEPRSDGYVDQEIEVLASLRGGPMERHTVAVEVYAGGIDCTGFGNLTVPVVGYSVRRNPILLTDAGELELVEGPLEVGCKNCIEFVERASKSTVAHHVSPAWDLTLSNVAEESFSYDDSGVYVRRGDFCVHLRDTGRFAQMDSALCARVRVRRTRGENLAVPGMARDPTRVLLDNANSRYLMVLRHGGCT